MNRTKSDQADGMVLQIVVASSVTFSGQFRTSPQATNDKQREQRETEDTWYDRDDNRFGGDCKQGTEW